MNENDVIIDIETPDRLPEINASDKAAAFLRHSDSAAVQRFVRWAMASGKPPLSRYVRAGSAQDACDWVQDDLMKDQRAEHPDRPAFIQDVCRHIMNAGRVMNDSKIEVYLCHITPQMSAKMSANRFHIDEVYTRYIKFYAGSRTRYLTGNKYPVTESDFLETPYDPQDVQEVPENAALVFKGRFHPSFKDGAPLLYHAGQPVQSQERGRYALFVSDGTKPKKQVVQHSDVPPTRLQKLQKFMGLKR